ncbi:MAG: L-ribulose-5-phosphate 4-epimerase AraD [Spirochaetota bacterium]
MKYEELRREVLAANLELPILGLVEFTWGNVSARDPDSGAVAIKPSGVAYKSMKAEHIVVVGPDGSPLAGKLRPSSDLATHLELYRQYPGIGSIVHTHSTWATVWAQACRGIPALGTTHADYFSGEVPCTRILTEAETSGDYERETGLVIIERFRELGLDPLRTPAVLVANHGPFAWGKDSAEAVHNAAVLDLVARMALETLALSPGIGSMPGHLLDKHFNRKHGPGAYYGQSKG